MPSPVQATSPTPAIALYGDYAFNKYLYVPSDYANTILEPLGPYALVKSIDSATGIQQIQVTLTGNLSVNELEHLYDYYLEVFMHTRSYSTTEEGVQDKYGGDKGLALYQFAKTQLKKSGRIRDSERGVGSDIVTGFSMVGRAIADGFRQNIYNTRDDRTEFNQLWNNYQKTKAGTRQRAEAVGKMNQELVGNSFTSISGLFPLASMFQDISQSLLGVVRYYDDDVMDRSSYIPGGIAFASTVGFGVFSTLYSGVAVTVGAAADLVVLVGALGAQGVGYDAKNNLPLPLAAQDFQLLVDTTLQIGTELVLKPIAYTTQGEFSAAGVQALSAMGWDPNSDEKFVKAAEVGIFAGSMLAIPTGLGIRRLNRYRAIRAQKNLIELTLVTSTKETIPVTFKPSGGWIRPFTLKPKTKLAPNVLADPNVKVISLLHPKRGGIWLRQIEGKPKWKLISKNSPLPNWGNLANIWRQKWTPVNVVIGGKDVAIFLRLRGREHLGYLAPVQTTEANLITALAHGPREVITLKGYRFVKSKGESNFYWDGKKPTVVPAKSFGTNLRGTPADFLRTLEINPREFAENARNLPRDVRQMWQNRGRNVADAPTPGDITPPERGVPIPDATGAYRHVGGKAVTDPVALAAWNSIGDGLLNYRFGTTGWRKWLRLKFTEKLRFRTVGTDPHGFPAYVVDRSGTLLEVVAKAEASNMILEVAREGDPPLRFHKTSTSQGPVWRYEESLAKDPPPPVNPAVQAANEALSRRVGPPRRLPQPEAPSSPKASVPASQVFGRHVAKILGIEKPVSMKKSKVVTKLETTIRQIPVDDAARTEPINMSEVDRTSYYDRYMNPRPAATTFVGRETVQDAYYAALRDNYMYPDGYWAFGGRIGHSYSPLGRFYVSIRGSYAVQYLKAIRQVYSEAQAHGYYMQFKMPMRLDEFARADAGVIYFEAQHQAWFVERVSQLVQGHSEWFADNSPLFTARVLDTTGSPIKGLSFGMDPPPGGSSFGGLIVRVLNNTIARLKAQKGVTGTKSLFGIIREEFENVGIDPNKPAFMKLNNQPGQVTFDVMDQHTAFLDPIHP